MFETLEIDHHPPPPLPPPQKIKKLSVLNKYEEF